MPYLDEERQRQYQREWMRKKRAREAELTTVEKLEDVPTPKINEKDTTVKVPEKSIEIWLPRIAESKQPPKKVRISQDRINQLLANLEAERRATNESYARLFIDEMEREIKRGISQARQIEAEQREKQLNR